MKAYKINPPLWAKNWKHLYELIAADPTLVAVNSGRTAMNRMYPCGKRDEKLHTFTLPDVPTAPFSYFYGAETKKKLFFISFQVNIN